MEHAEGRYRTNRIGCTGVVDNSFVRYLGKIPAEINVFELQKIVLLNTCYIVRRFLSTD